MSRDTRTEEEHTQLLAPKSCCEMNLQAAHYNPVEGIMGYDNTLEWIMAQITARAFGGICIDGACPACELVNWPAIPKKTIAWFSIAWPRLPLVGCRDQGEGVLHRKRWLKSLMSRKQIVNKVIHVSITLCALGPFYHTYYEQSPEKFW